MAAHPYEYPTPSEFEDTTELSVVHHDLAVADVGKPTRQYFNAGRQRIQVTQQHLKLDDHSEYDVRIYEPPTPGRSQNKLHDAVVHRSRWYQ